MASAASASSSLSVLKNRGSSSSSSPSGVRLGSTFCPPLRLLGVAGDPVFSAHVGSRVQSLRASGKPVKGAVSMANKSVGDLSGADLKGKKVFVRADLNVPLDHSQNITDDTRIRAALPTIKYLIANGAKVILSAHLGLPKGVTPKFSLSPPVPRLSELLGIEVVKADDCIGPEVENMVASLPDGGVLLLDQQEFAKKLASLADLFVNDAFGTAHRAHASTEKLTSQNVAVIGGGAAGLAAAKELRQEGHTVVVFERQSELGGTWLYNPQTESDPIGSDPNREVVHSSLYQSLRTNLSREIMGFRDFPFVATGMNLLTRSTMNLC